MADSRFGWTMQEVVRLATDEPTCTAFTQQGRCGEPVAFVLAGDDGDFEALCTAHMARDSGAFLADWHGAVMVLEVSQRERYLSAPVAGEGETA